MFDLIQTSFKEGWKDRRVKSNSSKNQHIIKLHKIQDDKLKEQALSISLEIALEKVSHSDSEFYSKLIRMSNAYEAGFRYSNGTAIYNNPDMFDRIFTYYNKVLGLNEDQSLGFDAVDFDFDEIVKITSYQEKKSGMKSDIIDAFIAGWMEYKGINKRVSELEKHERCLDYLLKNDLVNILFVDEAFLAGFNCRKLRFDVLPRQEVTKSKEAAIKYYKGIR